ncbi:hypothetical protein GA0116948_110117 [Chitinophaga costaii]|uniref:Uncharacterized protein n=1 Tax=Chitinophaga costaii TaxID=1335309 RepID=A0A1C4EYR4_9BACT|nr:hypothetical protein [Chitinophaga costaii]PUZ21551.1 hypothetical protein DCM91_16060 [Chitinophaga costaii]SCC48633.1 hypothetical protein GA0116948_110117 [Chitinophaga costaii]
MADFSSLMGIDSTTLRTLIMAYSAYAAYLEADETGENQQAATAYLYAAAYEVLLDQEKAKVWFAKAAACYTRHNNPYGVIASICHKSINYLGYIDYLERRNTTPDMQFYQLLNLTFIGENIKTAIRQEPVGRLQIPFQWYADAINATKNITGAQQAAQLPAVWYPLLSRMNEPVMQLRQDTLRWRQQQGTVIPIAPDTIATCLTLLSIAARNGISGAHISSLLATQTDFAFLPVKIALQI